MPATLFKKGSGTGVFLWYLQNFQEHLFYRAPLVAASQSFGYILQLTNATNAIQMQTASTESADVERGMWVMEKPVVTLRKQLLDLVRNFTLK